MWQGACRPFPVLLMHSWPAPGHGDGACISIRSLNSRVRVERRAQQEIQKLPYHNVVKWLPSSLRTKDPGGPDCMDVQVETSGGKKDLRMRCESPATVELLMQEIRTTVQVGSSAGGLKMHTLHLADDVKRVARP